MHGYVHLGHCRHFVSQRSALLNTKGEFWTEMQSSDCAFDLAILLLLVTLSFNVDMHWSHVWTSLESIFNGCTLHSGLFSLVDSKQKLIAFEI